MSIGTKIKLCGLSRECDILAANELMPDYIGFVFTAKSRRYVMPERAKALKSLLDRRIKAVGVFVNEAPQNIATLLANGTIDIAQLHGSEDEEYIRTLRGFTDKPIIQAFRIKTESDVKNAADSSADHILLDAPIPGSGTVFDWELIRGIKRDFFLAGGLTPDNVKEAIDTLLPYAVDVSSGIESDNVKDKDKMREFIRIVRERTYTND